VDILRASDVHLLAVAAAAAPTQRCAGTFLTSSDHEAMLEQTAGFFDLGLDFFASPEARRQVARDTHEAREHVRFDTADPGRIRAAWDGAEGFFFVLSAARAASLACRGIVMFPNRRCYRLVVGDDGELSLERHEVSADAIRRIEAHAERMGVDDVCAKLRSLVGAERGPDHTFSLS
jgi:hypothetical protein